MIPIYHIASSNFGDRIAPDIVRWLSGCYTEHTVKAPRYITIGSILASAQSGDTVWGTGAIRDGRVWDVAPRLDVRAVRGPLTRQLLLDSGIACPAIYGDPGMFVPEVFGVTVDPTTRRSRTRLGIIPHYIDEHRTPELLKAFPYAAIISTSDAPSVFVRKVSECRRILSSSLHGLITAEALGISARWVVLSDGVAGDGFKFHDYYLGSGRPKQPALDWKAGLTHDASWTLASIQYAPPPVYMRDAFLEACPFRKLA